MNHNIKKELGWLKITQKTYNLIAKKFSKTRKKRDEALDFFFSIFSPYGKTLEIGSGSARSLVYLEKIGFFKNSKNFYLGIDYSPKLISEARKRKEVKLYRKKIKFFKQNIVNLNLKNKAPSPKKVLYRSSQYMEVKNDQFDSIFALAVIHHLPKSFQLITFKKIYQTLKKGGIFAGYVWIPGKNITKKWQKIGEKSYFKLWENNPDLPIFYYYFDKAELKKLFKDAGFRKIKIFKNKKRISHIKENLFFIVQK